MAKKRKTNADRQRERGKAEQRAWNEFVPKVKAASAYQAAIEIVLHGPRPDEPGRRFYSNLDFYLGNRAVPGGANREEVALYAELIEKLRANGDVPADQAEEQSAALAAAMESRTLNGRM
jgi:hypothetical protein